MPLRYLGRVYHLDANRINASQREVCVNQLETWHANGVIFLEMSRDAYDEAGRGSDKRYAKANEYTWVTINDSIGGEAGFRREIEQIVFPGGVKNKSETNDVGVLFTARQAGATLVTQDGKSRTKPRKILTHAKALAEIGITVLSDQEALEEVNSLIRKRDQEAIDISERNGQPLPKWVGKDAS